MAQAKDTLVWLADMAALPQERLAAYAGWLGESERQRHAGFARPERRRQFVAGRALLRRALGQLLDTEPAAVLLQERLGLAPALLHPGSAGVGFSISHSGSIIACAASTTSPVGLDVERADPARDLLALAGQAFPPPDVERLRACSGAERTRQFYRMWCLQEARIKLGMASAAEYVHDHPGFILALCCGCAPVAAPVLVLVEL